MTKVEEFRNKWVAHCKACGWVGVPHRSLTVDKAEADSHDIEHMEKDVLD